MTLFDESMGPLGQSAMIHVAAEPAERMNDSTLQGLVG